jgi:hypothetical protein
MASENQFEGLVRRPRQAPHGELYPQAEPHLGQDVVTRTPAVPSAITRASAIWLLVNPA